MNQSNVDLLATLQAIASRRPRYEQPVRMACRIFANTIPTSDALAAYFTRHASVYPAYAEPARELAMLLRSGLIERLDDPVVQHRIRQAQAAEAREAAAKTGINIGDRVVVKETGWFGLVEFYDPSSEKYYVSHDIFEGAYYDPSNLQKVAAIGGNDSRQADSLASAPRQLLISHYEPHVLNSVRQVLASYELPAYDLMFHGFSGTQTDPGGHVRHATAQVEMRMPSGIGSDIRIEIPVEIRDGRVLPPSTMYWEGRPAVIGQVAFNEIRNAYTKTAPRTQGLYSLPIPYVEELPLSTTSIYDLPSADYMTSRYDTNYQDYGWSRDRRW